MAQLTDTLVSGDERVTGMIYGTQAGNYATCSTPAATAAKVVTIPGFVLTLGVHVRIKFSANNTAATPTLNVSGTGAKSIKVKGGNLPTAGDLAANGVYEFVYDGTNWELTGAVPTSHTHGNISNTGTLTDTAAAAAGNDYVVIRDADNNKIQTSTIKGTDVAAAVASNSTYTLTNPTTKPVRLLTTVLAHQLPANKCLGITVSLIATSGSSATCGKLMVMAYGSSSANTVAGIDACWIERCADIRFDAVKVGCVNQNASVSVFIMIDLSMCGSRTFNVHFMEDGGAEWNKYNTNGSESAMAFASFTAAESSCATIAGKSAFDVETFSQDGYHTDAMEVDTLSATGVAAVDAKFKLPDHIICPAMSSHRFLVMTQLVNYKTHRFDMWYWSDAQRVYLYNNLGFTVQVHVPGNSGGSGGASYDITAQTSFALNGAGRSKPTSVWVTRIDANIYVTYGY
jgi:hypothetical protein